MVFASVKRRFALIISLLFFGVFLSTAISSVFLSGPVWDDEIEYIGLLDQISFGKNLIFNRENANLDYESAIATNLEFYGVINKIIGLILFRFTAYIFSWIPFISVGDEFLGFVLINKIFTVILFICTLYLVFLTSSLLSLRYRHVPSLLLLGFPTYVGHSWLNIKDIPFAFAYTLLTFSAILYVKYCREVCPLKSSTNNYRYLIVIPRLLLIVAAAIAVACRPAFIPIAEDKSTTNYKLFIAILILKP